MVRVASSGKAGSVELFQPYWALKFVTNGLNPRLLSDDLIFAGMALQFIYMDGQLFHVDFEASDNRRQLFEDFVGIHG